MNDDVGRLDDRVLKLQRRFSQVEEDIRQIRISSDKVQKHAVRIAEVDLEDQRTLPVPDLLDDSGK